MTPDEHRHALLSGFTMSLLSFAWPDAMNALGKIIMAFLCGLAGYLGARVARKISGAASIRPPKG
jgi:hypothetical protein